MSSVQDYVLLIGASVTQADVARVAEEAINAPQIFFYGLLLELQPVQALRADHNFGWIPEVMEVLCYGTVDELRSLPSSVQEHLAPQIYRKACKLSVLSLCMRNNVEGVLPIQRVQQAAQARNPAETEELLIEMVSDGLLRLRIDQRGGMVVLHEFAAREARRDTVKELRMTLESWCRSCDTQVAMLETLMTE